MNHRVWMNHRKCIDTDTPTYIGLVSELEVNSDMGQLLILLRN